MLVTGLNFDFLSLLETLKNGSLGLSFLQRKMVHVCEGKYMHREEHVRADVFLRSRDG